MRYQGTTPVPNEVFDVWLPLLSESEYKILCIIIRQTYGWVDTKTGGRKMRDRISHGQFVKKTKLSRRAVSSGVEGLVAKGLISITSHSGKSLHLREERRGKTVLYYNFNLSTQRSQHLRNGPTIKMAHPIGLRSVGEVLRNY